MALCTTLQECTNRIISQCLWPVEVLCLCPMQPMRVWFCSCFGVFSLHGIGLVCLGAVFCSWLLRGCVCHRRIINICSENPLAALAPSGHLHLPPPAECGAKPHQRQEQTKDGLVRHSGTWCERDAATSKGSPRQVCAKVFTGVSRHCERTEMLPQRPLSVQLVVESPGWVR